MNLYVPDNVDESPGVIVTLHSCGNPYESDSLNYVQSSADEHGFIVIQPTNGAPDCWTSDAGQAGEKPDILKMVTYVLENHGADPNRVYAMGASSGACMTLALMATHPDVFKAGIVLAGVPYGAWRQGGNCSVCNQPASPMSEDAWGNIVRQNAPANYAGPWPRIQLWHGSSDTTLNFGWMAESAKQWKNIHGLTGDGSAATGPAGWSRVEYQKDGAVVLQINTGAGKGHYLRDEIPAAEYVKFFELDVDPPPVDPGGDTSGEAVTSGGDDTSGNESADVTETTTPTAPTSSNSTETTSAPSTSAPVTPPPVSDPGTPPGAPNPTPITPAPPASSSAPAGTDPAPTTSPTGTDTAPVQSADNGGDAGCQCELGVSHRPTRTWIGVLLAGVAALITRRARRSK